MSRSVQVLSSFTLAALVACGSASRAPRGCSTNADCSSDAHCSAAGACVASAPPTATVAARAEQEYWTYYVLEFDAGAALDPAAREQVGEYRWSVEGPLAAQCPPEIQGPPGATLRVVVTCPGEWIVRLVVTDSRGFESAPVALPISVREPPSGVSPSDPTLAPRFPPRVEVGPPVETGHHCAADGSRSSGWRCTLEDADRQPHVTLTATGADAAGGAVSYAWTCEAPSSAHGAIPLLAGATTATPRLEVVTDGLSISGEYRCIVTVTDADHQQKSAIQTVRVGNRPPVLAPGTPAPLLAPHRYAPGIGWTASVAVPAYVATDPDGDPISAVQFTASDGLEGSMTEVRGGRVEIAVAKDRPGSLIGPDVSRTVSLAATDPDGASAAFTWQVLVANEPPRWARGGGALAVPHTFTNDSYVASGLLGDFVDPDGDPVTAVELTDPFCVGSISGSSVRADCVRPFSGIGALPSFLFGRTLQIVVRDPWSASAPDLVGVALQNTPPAVTPVGWTPATSVRRVQSCCVYGGMNDNTCVLHVTAYLPTSIDVSAIPYVEPDGDPVEVTVVPHGTENDAAQKTSCRGGSCTPAIHLALPGRSLCGNVVAPSGVVDVILDDGSGPRPAVQFTWTSR